MVIMTTIDTLMHAYNMLGVEGSPWHVLALLMLTLTDKLVTYKSSILMYTWMK